MEVVPSTTDKIVHGMPVLYTLSDHDVQRINTSLGGVHANRVTVRPPRYYAVGEDFPATVLRHLDGTLCLVVHLWPWPPREGLAAVCGWSYTRAYPGEHLGHVTPMPPLLAAEQPG